MSKSVKQGRYKAIFSDIDGTLLNTSHQIPDKTKKKITQLKKQGIPFILVSARMPKGMTGIRDELGIKSPMICYSGAYIVDEEDQPVYSAFLPSETAKKVCGRILDEQWEITVNLYSYDHWFVKDIKDPWVKEEMKITGIAAEECLFQDDELYKGIHKILCMGKKEEIRKLEKYLVSQFPKIRIYRSKDTYLEIMSMKASKSDAIKILEKRFGILQREMIAFGDSYNDIDMLSYAGLGVAMGNADQEVKDSADIVTDTNDREGLCKILEEAFS